MKIQFCCGGNRLPEFENFDAEVDITKPLQFKDRCAEFIFIEHGLEHVHVHDGFRFILECKRMLEPGGVLRICVPILSRLTERAHAIDLIYGHGHQMVYSRDTLRDLLWAAGFDSRNIRDSDRLLIDSHWKAIGTEKDDLETLRMEAIK